MSVFAKGPTSHCHPVIQPQQEDTEQNDLQCEIRTCCDSKFWDVLLFALNSTLKQGRINISNNRRKLENEITQNSFWTTSLSHWEQAHEHTQS